MLFRSNEAADIVEDTRAATTIMLVSEGYPGDYPKGFVMSGFEKTSDCLLFHAGTKEENGQILTNGGRVLAITAFGETISDALKTANKNADLIDFQGKTYRKDIGRDVLT